MKKENPSRRRFRKRALWLLLAGVCLLGVLGLVWVWANGRDIPPPEVGDLIPQRTEVSPENNAFVHFVRAGEALVWPDAGGWNPDIIAKMLPENGEALRLLKAGLACEVCVNPGEGILERFGAFLKFDKLGRLLGAEASVRLEAGDRSAALQAVLDYLRFAALLRHEPGGQAALLESEMVLHGSLAEARRLANDPLVTTSELAALLAALRDLPEAEPPFRRALMEDFAMSTDLLDLLTSQPEADTGGDWFSGLRWPPGDNPIGLLLRRYSFHPNRTRQMLADHTRAMIRDLPLPLEEPEAPQTLDPPPAPPKFVRIAKPNAWGEQFCALRMMALCPPDFRAQSDQQRVGSLLVVAVRSFELGAGRLPASLEELVPDFLAEVPASPIDGRPFRYTPDERVVHATDASDIFRHEDREFDFRNETDVFTIGPPSTSQMPAPPSPPPPPRTLRRRIVVPPSPSSTPNPNPPTTRPR